MEQHYRCEFTAHADGRKLRRAAKRKRRIETKKNKQRNKKVMKMPE